MVKLHIYSLFLIIIAALGLMLFIRCLLQRVRRCVVRFWLEMEFRFMSLMGRELVVFRI